MATAGKAQVINCECVYNVHWTYVHMYLYCTYIYICALTDKEDCDYRTIFSKRKQIDLILTHKRSCHQIDVTFNITSLSFWVFSFVWWTYDLCSSNKYYLLFNLSSNESFFNRSVFNAYTKWKNINFITRLS